MSATRDQLSPQANAELLRISALVGPVHPLRDPSAWEELKRDLALGTDRAFLLLATVGEAPLRRAGPDGGVMVAFTDDEAAEAWAAAQHRAAPASSSTLAFGERPKSEREGRQMWTARLEEAEAVALVVNPAGPLGFVIQTQELRQAPPRLLERARQGKDEEAWLDLAARSAERARLRELVDGLTAELERGAPGEVHLHDQNRLGSLLVTAELQFLSGRVRLARGEVKAGVYQMMWGAVAWGRFGDPYRCIDGLLEVGEMLEGLRGESFAGGEPTTWVAPALGDLASVLARLSIGYREPEARRYT